MRKWQWQDIAHRIIVAALAALLGALAEREGLTPVPQAVDVVQRAAAAL